jgi:hypothetical protein
MSHSTRSSVVPQLEVIHASDDTIRAELIALPLVRTGMGDHTIEDPAAAAAVAQADVSLGGVQSIA